METAQRRKLSHEVLDRLITAITTAEFPPGSQLPSERELMAALGVGRPSIREAMQSLQQMGLIRISHGERARVVHPTPDAVMDQVSNAMVMLLATSARGLDELKEARLWTETALVRMAARNASPADSERLEALVRELDEARGDSSRFVAADMAFHGLIAEISGNALVAATLKGILHWLSRFKREMVSARGKERLTVAEHEKILAAIAGGNADAAAQAMRDHITRASQLYRQTEKPRTVPA